MGDCVSTQQTTPPTNSNTPQKTHTPQPNPPHQHHQCQQHHIYSNNPSPPLQTPPQSNQDFSMLLLNNILTQFVDLDREEKSAIFQNVQQLIFKPLQYFGGIKILDKDTCVSVLGKDSVQLMVAAGFGVGRVFAVAHQHVFKDFLVKDKDWIIYLRNIIKWVTKNRQPTPQKPTKILIVSMTQLSKINTSLARTNYHVQINYEQKITGIKLSDYDCIFMYDLINKYFTNDDCSNVVEYVRGGGGLVIGMRGWSYKSYGDGKGLRNWGSQCCYNRILEPMGLVFSEESVTLQSINFSPKQIINLAQPQLKPYTKQLNPLFTQSYFVQTQHNLLELKYKLLEGVTEIDFGIDVNSSLKFPPAYYIGLLSQSWTDFCIAGNYEKGKVLAYGHWDIHQCEYIKQPSIQRFVQNIFKWMVGDKKNVQVGLLFEKGGWLNFKWNGLIFGKNITSTIIENAEDFKNQDIIFVGYYPTYPKNLNKEVLSKLEQYVKNGGNIFFGSHGWGWFTDGDYKDNSSLVYDEDFASYLILKQFEIDLKPDRITPQKPYRIVLNKQDLSVKDYIKNDLIPVLKDPTKNLSTKLTEYNKIYSIMSGVQHSHFSSVCPIQLYHELVDTFIQSRFNMEKYNDTISFQDNDTCLVFNLMNQISNACPPHICRALPPSLNKYPGCASVRVKEKTVQVYKNRNHVVFTGLYINPGEVVKVRHNNDEFSVVNLLLRINFNENISFMSLGTPKRFNNISKTYRVYEKQFLIASPHGGIIYFQVLTKSQIQAPLIFTFEGAYEMPYWNQDIHSYADFQRIKKIPAPMFAIQTKQIILIGPTFGILPQVNIKIERLSKFWNKVIGIYKEYRGAQQNPFVKDSIFNDINLTKSAMHSGYPLMTHDDVTFEILGVGQKLYTNPTWGLYHELGHNYENNKWSVPQIIEITPNIFVLYLNYRMHGISVAQTMWMEKKLQDTVKKHFQKQTRGLSDFLADNFLGLAFFAILMEELGYEIYGQLHKVYNNIVLPNHSNEVIFNTLVEQLSIIVHLNLWYYFKKWGMPVTTDSLNKLKDMKKYQCKRFPFITKE